MTTRPLSYEPLKWVLEYLPVEQRVNIQLHCATLRITESLVPLRINALQMNAHRSNFDTYYFISTERDNFYKFMLKRRGEAIVDTVTLEVNQFPANDTEKKFHLPKDFKMKVKNVEVDRVDALALGKLSSYIIGGPLKSFRVLLPTLTVPDSTIDLIHNARKLGFRPSFNTRLEVETVMALPQKDINIDAKPDESTSDFILRLVRARLGSDLETGTNITIDVLRRYLENTFERLLALPQARQAVVVHGDVEDNRFSFPCVCLPKSPAWELNVYELPAPSEKVVLKMMVMPIGSAD